jgi:hypothetical protein
MDPHSIEACVWLVHLPNENGPVLPAHSSFVFKNPPIQRTRSVRQKNSRRPVLSTLPERLQSAYRQLPVEG